MILRPSRTLLGQFLVYGVAPSVAVLLIVIGINGLRTFRLLRDGVKQVAEAEAVALANDLDGWNRATVAVVQVMRDAAESGLFGRRAESVALLRRILEEHPDFEGTYYTYELDADGRDAESLAALRLRSTSALPAEALDPSGRFIPYFFRGSGADRVIAMKNIVDDDRNPFYQGPRTRFLTNADRGPELTEPYNYEGVQMTEVTLALVIQGRFAGIAGVDRSLATIQGTLHEIAERSGLNVMLLTEKGNFITAVVGDPDDPGDLAEAYAMLPTKPLAQSPWASSLTPLVARQDDVSAMFVDNPITGERTLHAEARVATGGWRVIIEVPAARLMGEVLGSVLVNLGVGLAGALLVIVLLVRMAVKLSGRIREVSGAARDVADGDLTRTYAVEGHDEASGLLSSMNDMTSRLNELVSRVRSVTLGITGTATDLSGASRQQEEVAQSFGASSAEIAAAVRQITMTGSELLRGMEQLSSAASDSARLATEGRQGLEEMGGTMSGLAAATGSVASRLAAINEKAMSINAIVDTITKVADQTNLLSVNAAIEAEKAGESGRGFLVVAREIRRLADQTAAATLDIETTVRQMQGAVSGGVMEMDRFSEQVRRGVGTVGQVGQRLTQVIDRVGAVEGRFGEVTQGMQSQVQGAEQIRQSMDALAQNASRAREATREFAEASASLQESLTQLRAAVNLFRLRDGD
ncbi:MAG: methyl-accepting chemotaxis protein [Planctomycetes bacterium]|nr:methyl-accepting chemotaxis protein [Planctomycetota bacterium]